ncbi:hypothetical protein [Streptomyces phaeochromogenes]|uniref:hypothetical protein n=1 Tax=Streptomyces phaeochromogenes TaxID=1923 RepID=UPI0033E6DFE9
MDLQPFSGFLGECSDIEAVGGLDLLERAEGDRRVPVRGHVFAGVAAVEPADDVGVAVLDLELR